MAQIAPVLPQPALMIQNLRKKIKNFKIKGIVTFRSKNHLRNMMKFYIVNKIQLKYSNSIILNTKIWIFKFLI